MALNQNDLIALYRGLARTYDLSSNLYRMIGFRMGAFRKACVGALALRAGDNVVELGCGTGLNFPLLHQAVGPKGSIVGVDMTDAMLVKAQERVRRHGWSNVELIQADAAQYKFRSQVDGVNSECMVRRLAASENRNGGMVCANVFGLCWSRNSGPRWNALRSVPH